MPLLARLSRTALVAALLVGSIFILVTTIIADPLANATENQPVAQAAAVTQAAVTQAAPGTPTSSMRPKSNSGLAVSADGTRFAVSNREAGTVAVVDLADRKVRHEIPVGSHPEGIAFLGSSHQFAVAVYGDDVVAIVDADTAEVVNRVAVFDEPYGVVSTSDGSRLFVTLEYPAEVAEIDPAAGTVLRSFPAGSMLRGIALDESRQRLYVSEYLTSTVHGIELQSGAVVASWAGGSTDNLSRQLVLHPSGDVAYVPHQRSRTHVNQGEGSILPYVSIVRTKESADPPRSIKPMDSFFGAYVTANPFEADVSPDGKTFAVVFSGTNDGFIADALNDGYKELTPRKILRLGNNPRSVRFTPDGSLCLVHNALDFNVEVLRTTDWSSIGKVSVCSTPLTGDMLRGKILFYSALPPMASRRWISCSSCHPDGDPDGRTWLNAEGMRNTMSLFGMGWTHPIHWSADRDEVQDFEHTIRSQLMQGRGLLRGTLHDSLGAPNTGLSSDLDALAVYSNSHHAVPTSPHAKQGLSAEAKRGKALFESAVVGCASCHAGPYFTDSVPQKPYVVHNVGTGGDDPHETLGPKYDTPSLLGAYRTAPYLHHGLAGSLHELLTKYNPRDEHGKTSHLSTSEIDDLVAYVKALPYEDAESAAKNAGLRFVSGAATEAAAATGSAE